ncbi:hypothetical protein SAMN05216464_12189 [Mucilaginibacter pineti]|uniref:SnoaL-like domain-containing protein n=1 Tax=Mucilaginibacter pineti TaxID=1391627 RepID=A0A1G7MHI1_9SPHI|nr:nuclear transport factor 2 family protein [Mucilaginibacter pineti]SDF61066.1 hypothetical protein SAMN05216464_12189 [Mucilaginibacter pineti]
MEEGPKIVAAITNLFKGADARDWELVQSVMAPSVFVDYTSMKGGEAETQTPEQVVAGWADFLPGFDSTNHQLSSFKVQLHGHEAEAQYSTTADHFIGSEVWTVIATYQTKLVKENSKWLINYHKINYDRQSGNTSLPKMAHQIIADRVNS